MFIDKDSYNNDFGSLIKDNQMLIKHQDNPRNLNENSTNNENDVEPYCITANPKKGQIDKSVEVATAKNNHRKAKETTLDPEQDLLALYPRSKPGTYNIDLDPHDPSTMENVAHKVKNSTLPTKRLNSQFTNEVVSNKKKNNMTSFEKRHTQS